MSYNIIKQINLKGGEPSIKFTSLVRERETCDSMFPGKGSDPVLPAPSFVETIEKFAELAVTRFSLSPDWQWRIDSVAFLWDKEFNKFGFFAHFSAFNAEIGKKEIGIEQNSPTYIPADLMEALEKLMTEAGLFIGGKSAQGNLFDQAENEQAA